MTVIILTRFTKTKTNQNLLIIFPLTALNQLSTKMGKSKKGRQGYSEKQNLADQIIDGRVVKGKARNKIRLRHDEDELVSIVFICLDGI